MSEMVRLVEPLIPTLRHDARALLRDHSAADDLVQDCLERVISRWHQRREERRRKRHAYVNEVLDTVRQKEVEAYLAALT